LRAQPGKRSESAPVRLKNGGGEAPPRTMPQVEVNIPDQIEMQIAQLVEQGEFVSREEAVEQLLSSGIRAYKTSGPSEEEEGAGLESEGGMMGHEDEYVF
jgi:Arc/MetJ-type ribon-helix-helix transcriptional regulator